ncbi:hypothetical protein KAR28_01530 [Candidatus Parcubacteria bacterium]|nr:hypothetical protein [Candidatus Parcubacteria bacterium]
MLNKQQKIILLADNSGAMLVIALVAAGLFLVILLGSIGLALLQQKLNLQKVAAAQAFHIAEAGANYYRWVLYHDNNEYCNGEACVGSPDYGPYGPYSYMDDSGAITGYYELYITPPLANGSTIVNIKSIGWSSDYSGIKKTIEVQCGIPAWSSFSTLANAHIRFGLGTEVWGPIHSNAGIRFDGIAHNLVTSALLEYDDPDPPSHPTEFGVHTHVYEVGNYDPNEVSTGANPPSPPNYPAVFQAGRKFPVPIISFDLLDNYVNEALALAGQSGIVLEASGDEGYHIIFKTNDTIDIYIVENITPQCKYFNPGIQKSDTDGIVSESVYLLATSTPPNGLIFVKDNVWVEGQIDGNRVTVLAFIEPLGGSVSDIIINNDLTYTNYDGTDAIGLIAQRNINIGLFSDDNLQIDAGLIAKQGRIGRNYFPCTDANDCSSAYCSRNTITIYGSLATRDRYGFAYTDGTGYQNRLLNYDNHLTYSPPPHYPSTGEYTFISWNEK